MKMKIKYAQTPTGCRDGWLIMCPACDVEHHLDARYNHNGKFDKPSFMPPLKVITSLPGAPEGDKQVVCHSIITNGAIAFRPDCTHAMAGLTVPLPDIS